jgi:hypothetical protein
MAELESEYDSNNEENCRRDDSRLNGKKSLWWHLLARLCSPFGVLFHGFNLLANA